MATLKKITKKARNESSRSQGQFFIRKIDTEKDGLANIYRVINTNIDRFFEIKMMTIDSVISFMDKLGRLEDKNWNDSNSFPNSEI